jgi:ABC-type polar amino acid transport system ATPase subunit
MLQAINIQKKIKNREILKQVSLTLQPGEIVSVVGPSGAGKTSFLRAISLIDIADSGSLMIDEKKYHFPLKIKINQEFPYPNLTVVFQQFFIWPHLTIRQNLLLPVRKNFDERHFTQLVRLFQMDSFLNRYPSEASMGEKQRTALVRALLLKPKYLLLDEVTSALDVEQAQLILGHLKEIANTGVGIVFVSHALHLASQISDKVIFLDQGKIVEEGTGDILINPKTARLKKFVAAAKLTN